MIIALSGKKQSGKDTVCNIIKYLSYKYNEPRYIGTFENYMNRLKEGNDVTIVTNWQRKLFAGKLKQMVCLLIGCTMEQLESEEFKNSRLGEEWKGGPLSAYIGNEEILPTVRLVLQKLGTELGRNILHPNTWINALMIDYEQDTGFKYPVEQVDKTKPLLEPQELRVLGKPEKYNNGYPNWIITDVRFPNEVKAIEDRGGVVIRINRQMYATRCLSCDQPINIYHEEDRCPICGSKDHSEIHEVQYLDQHPSETALDDHDFEHYIHNTGTIENLIEKVRTLLQELKIIE